jgi:glycosyltransferase involved in cell wall biosynthesis
MMTTRPGLSKANGPPERLAGSAEELVGVTDVGRPRGMYLLGHSPIPPVTGGGRRAAAIIDALADHYDMTLVVADDVDAPDGSWARAALRLLARRRSRLALLKDSLEGVVRGQHVLLVRSVRAGTLVAFRERLRTERPAFVLLGRPFVGPYVAAALDAGAVVVIDADESLPRVAWGVARSRYASRRQRLRAFIEAIAVVGRMERSSYPLASQVWVSSELERASFARFVSQDRIRVIPNVMPAPDAALEAGAVRAVAFVGSYFYPPNEAAAIELISSIMPAVRSRGGPRSLVLIGPEPSPSLLRAASGDPEVEVVGQVRDIRFALRDAGVLVVPVRAGGGTRVKILEAMVAGVPVVSTALGVEGLDLMAEEHVLIADTSDQFAEQVGRIAADAVLRNRLVGNAAEHVRTHNSTAVLVSSIGAALEGVSSLDGSGRPVSQAL